MKLMHLADLHLGRRMNDISLIPDQIHLLEQAAALAAKEQVDAVVIAGDVYDKTTPTAEAMAAFSDFLDRLTTAAIRVFIISGNHDAARRIAYFESLIRPSGVYVSPDFDGTLRRYTLNDAHGPVTFTLLPFLRPGQVRRYYPEQTITTAQDAIAAVIERHKPDPECRNVLLCHQFVSGAVISDSEEHSIGGLDQIDGALFDGYDYVAMGHLHQPQQLLRETMRYAGSLMKYSFSEVHHRKTVPIITLGAKGDIQIEKHALKPLRDVRMVEGHLSELMAMDYSEDYIHVTVTDELVPPDARVSLTTVFPNMMKFTVRNSKTKESIDVRATETIRDRSVLELLDDFYRLQNNDVALPESHRAVAQAILLEMEEDT